MGLVGSGVPVGPAVGEGPDVLAVGGRGVAVAWAMPFADAPPRVASKAMLLTRSTSTTAHDAATMT